MAGGGALKTTKTGAGSIPWGFTGSEPGHPYYSTWLVLERLPWRHRGPPPAPIRTLP